MSAIRVFKENETFMRVDCSEELMLKLFDHFSFFAPKYIFDPRYKAGDWDGQIHLLRADRRLYLGLFDKLQEYADEHGIELIADWDPHEETDFSQADAEDFIKKIVHNTSINPYDYQIKGFIEAIGRRRTILVSPTASGKSLTIYLIAWLLAWKMGGRILIIVPRTQLAHQIFGDFLDYSNGKTTGKVRLIQGAKSKENITERVVVAVWNSIYKMPPEWFAQFSGVIGDEVHGFQAKSLRSIVENMDACPYRIGLTGSMGKTKVHHLVLEGLFGSPLTLATSKALQERGILAQLNIRALVLKHDRDVLRRDLYNYDPKELTGSQKFAKEIAFIISRDRRNEFIAKLVAGLKGNTLILCDRVDDHGLLLHEKISALKPGKTHFVHGKVAVKAREAVRTIVETSDDMAITASLGSFSTGINMKRIHNIVFAYIYKAPITLMQSIGRGLRVAADKTTCQLIDITDDLRLSDHGRDNYVLGHFKERIAVYREEQFQFKVSSVYIG